MKPHVPSKHFTLDEARAAFRKISPARSAINTRSWTRRSTVTDEMVGHTIIIDDGPAFETVHITSSMVGHKLGEFMPPKLFQTSPETKRTKGVRRSRK